MLENLEEVPAHQDFAAAQDEEEHAGFGQLIEDVAHLGRGHLTVVVVIEIAMLAALVAAVRDVQVGAQRHASIKRPLAHFRNQLGHSNLSNLCEVTSKRLKVAG